VFCFCTRPQGTLLCGWASYMLKVRCEVAIQIYLNYFNTWWNLMSQDARDTLHPRLVGGAVRREHEATIHRQHRVKDALFRNGTFLHLAIALPKRKLACRTLYMPPMYTHTYVHTGFGKETRPGTDRFLPNPFFAAFIRYSIPWNIHSSYLKGK
jgi:hypothetical protein